MKKINREIKNKKVLFLVTTFGIILIVVFFVILFINKNKNPINPGGLTVPKEKNMEEVAESLRIPITDKGKINTVTDEQIKSLRVPITDKGKINTVTDEQIKSLRVPIK